MARLRAASDALNHAYEGERETRKAWTIAIEMGDPQTIEIVKIELDHAGQRVTDAFRVIAVAQAAADGSLRSLEAQAVQLLMRQAEAGAEQRALATDELMKSANSQAASLKRATWALAGATLVLVIATVVMIFVTANA